MNRSLLLNPNWVLFTDLDGTLLDAKTYSFAPAAKALRFLSGRNIPVIPCTSKTFEETASICKEAELDGPFIIENGSAVCIPQNYFSILPDKAVDRKNYQIITLGREYADILEFFDRLKTQFKISVRGFHEMDTGEIEDLTGLDKLRAQTAKERGFSEPFIIMNGNSLPETVFHSAEEEGFKILKGNRFYHLLGNTDKGKAVQALKAVYQQNNTSQLKTIGIGDSPNDLAMLQAVDLAVAVKRADGSYAEGLSGEFIHRTAGIGPLGWQEAVFTFIKE